MTSTTSNLSLTTYNTVVDTSVSMYDYINTVSGSSSTSNMQKIDAFAGAVSASFADVNTTAMGFIPGGRLTLGSGSPVVVSVSSASVLYYTPYIYNKIQLYNASASSWNPYTFSECNLSLESYATEKNYDIFVYNNSGSPTLESLVWSDGFTRATNLIYQDGRLVKSGDSTRLYLGTIRIDTDGFCHDTQYRRFVWNNYNKVRKQVVTVNTTASWSYSGSDWRVYNNSSGNTTAYYVIGQRDVIFGTSRQLATVTASGTGECSVGTFINGTTWTVGTTIYNIALGSSIKEYDTSMRGIDQSEGLGWITMREKAGAGATMTVYGSGYSGKVVLNC